MAIGVLDHYAHLQMNDNKSSAVDTEAMKIKRCSILHIWSFYMEVSVVLFISLGNVYV